MGQLSFVLMRLQVLQHKQLVDTHPHLLYFLKCFRDETGFAHNTVQHHKQ